jgi:DNA-binding transcriptional LysR family regulator
MDRFDAMRAFIRIVERRSFTLAAQDIGLPRSTITQTIKQLEARLGVRLLQRTTRSVSPTLDGEAYYRRCIAIIDDVEDAEGAFGGTKPKGMLRIEVQGTLARHFLMPGLPDFFAHYPDIEITMSEGDRYVDIVREGVDCVLRFGALPDSDMVARRIGLLRRMTTVYGRGQGMQRHVGGTDVRLRPGKLYPVGPPRPRPRPDAELSCRGRSRAGHARPRSIGISAARCSGIPALPPQPATVATRTNFHRLGSG